MKDIELLSRIERALRFTDLWEEEATKEAFNDRDFIRNEYSRLKGEINSLGFRNSFSEAQRLARIEWLRTIL